MGWFLLHDRDLPAGGNVDHIAAGPPGVAVVDAKAWTFSVRVSNGHLYAGKFSRDSQVDYGTLVDPDSSTFKLGYLDLATGDLRPSIQGRLSKDHQPAEYYLRLLRDRQPPAR